LIHLPRNRRAYARSLTAAACAFVFVVLVIHGFLTHVIGLRAEATYLDDMLVAVAVGLLVLSLEARYEAELRTARERAYLSTGLNHHIRNALQTIVYVSSELPDETQAKMLAEAASRIEWAVREIPRQAQQDDAAAPQATAPVREKRTS
jgi:hypothetical protein